MIFHFSWSLLSFLCLLGCHRRSASAENRLSRRFPKPRNLMWKSDFHERRAKEGYFSLSFLWFSWKHSLLSAHWSWDFLWFELHVFKANTWGQHKSWANCRRTHTWGVRSGSGSQIKLELSLMHMGNGFREAPDVRGCVCVCPFCPHEWNLQLLVANKCSTVATALQTEIMILAHWRVRLQHTSLVHNLSTLR